jgi:hypothetical protein
MSVRATLETTSLADEERTFLGSVAKTNQGGRFVGDSYKDDLPTSPWFTICERSTRI